jgi:hypothetical protein
MFLRVPEGSTLRSTSSLSILQVSNFRSSAEVLSQFTSHYADVDISIMTQDAIMCLYKPTLPSPTC